MSGTQAHDEQVDPQSSDLPGVTVQRTDPAIRMQAQLIGTLVVDPTTNCLLLRTISIGGTPLIDVAWPLGWSVAIRDGAPALLDTTGATAAHVGDDVAVGGGFVEVERADAVPCTGQQHVFEASGLSRL